MAGLRTRRRRKGAKRGASHRGRRAHGDCMQLGERSSGSAGAGVADLVGAGAVWRIKGKACKHECVWKVGLLHMRCKRGRAAWAHRPGMQQPGRSLASRCAALGGTPLQNIRFWLLAHGPKDGQKGEAGCCAVVGAQVGADTTGSCSSTADSPPPARCGDCLHPQVHARSWWLREGQVQAGSPDTALPVPALYQLELLLAPHLGNPLTIPCWAG